jgi:hypothetical protein
MWFLVQANAAFFLLLFFLFLQGFRRNNQFRAVVIFRRAILKRVYLNICFEGSDKLERFGFLLFLDYSLHQIWDNLFGRQSIDIYIFRLDEMLSQKWIKPHLSNGDQYGI